MWFLLQFKQRIFRCDFTCTSHIKAESRYSVNNIKKNYGISHSVIHENDPYGKDKFWRAKRNLNFLIFVPDISVWNIEQEDKLYVFQTEISGINYLSFLALPQKSVSFWLFDFVLCTDPQFEIFFEIEPLTHCFIIVFGWSILIFLWFIILMLFSFYIFSIISEI